MGESIIHIKETVEGIPMFSLMSRFLDVILDSCNMIGGTFIGVLD